LQGKGPFVFKVGQKLGKYQIERRLAQGGFAAVFQAFDTIEGTRVALKVPHSPLVNKAVLDDFRREARLVARLDHVNILPLKNADFIDGHFVIVLPLGEKTLADRLRHRMTLPAALDFAQQMLDAVAYAHRQRIVHLDLKPENFILFLGNRLRLSDFGISRVARRTVRASGSGTVGYIAPEQAMGKPSPRSDVFSLGLIFYRMLAGKLPEWPFELPLPGYDRLRRRAHPDLIDFVQRAMDVAPRKRFRDADQMQTAFGRIKSRALQFAAAQPVHTNGRAAGTRNWQEVRRQQFQREFGRVLETRYQCAACAGPVSEFMQTCPWCGTSRAAHQDDTRFPAQCPRCERGLKLDWTFCPWCYGPGFELMSNREYSDRRYTGRCANSGCSRKLLMPFMRYCPWCHRKVKRKWKIPGSNETCTTCGWGYLSEFWDYCPWCKG
jgi:eukaryotic-like serine/threonine-protein kinase